MTSEGAVTGGSIAIIGAGAIGSLVAGYLALKGQAVSLIGHADSVKAVRERGLHIAGVRGNFDITVEASDRLCVKPDLVILCVKTQDIEKTLQENFALIRDSVILTIQNGARADRIVARYIPRENIISSIVMFVATQAEPGRIIHNSEGSWILGNLFQCPVQDKIRAASTVLGTAFTTGVSDQIQGMKYLKIFVNANNSIAAILGMSLQEAFANIEISRIGIELWREGFNVLSKSGIGLASLPDFPVENLTRLLSMPGGEAACVWSQIMSNLSKYPIYGSILQSIKRGRPSEIDYINGEFVALAEENHERALLNARLVQLVHQVEATGEFLTSRELLDQVKGWVN